METPQTFLSKWDLLTGQNSPLHRHLERERPAGEWGGQPGLKWLPLPSTQPCGLRPASLCFCSFSSQGFSWGKFFVFTSSQLWLASAAPPCYRTTFLFKYHHLSPLVSLSQFQITERENPVGVTWVMSISGAVGSSSEARGRWYGSRGVSLKAWRGGNVRGWLQKGAVHITRKVEESNDSYVSLL